MKRADDTDNGAKQTDERTDRGDGREPGHAALKGRNGLAGRGLRGSLYGNEVAGRAGSAGLPAIGFVNVLIDLRQGAGLAVESQLRNLLQARGLAEGADEAAALLGRFVEGGDLAEDHCPGIEAGNKKEEKNADGDPADIVEHFKKGADSGGSGRGGTVSLEDEEDCSV